MSKAKAIEILKRMATAHEYPSTWITEAIQELEEGAPEPAYVKRDQDPPLYATLGGDKPEYRPKCDWCGDYLGVCGTSDGKGHDFCSARCQMCYEDHDKIADLMAWRDSFVATLKQELGP